jgi:acyl carrier protein
VREAVVTAQRRGGAGDRLVAYVTGDPPPAAGELAGHLRRHLPEYMVPAVFVVLPALPLTVSGKVDRTALPEPEAERPELLTPYLAPEDGLEISIAELWRGLLGVERVGLDDNFFELGGHSLLMAELRARLAAELGHDVPMVELFQYPTVGSLAGHLRRPAAPRGDGTPLGARDHAENRRRLQATRQHAAARRTRARNDG